MKQSSIEWYERQVWDLLIRFENKEITLGQYGVTRVDLFNQAKEMHNNETTVKIQKAIDKFEEAKTNSSSFRDIIYLDGVLAVLDTIKNETFNTK
jgi:hypothetical protein